MEDDLIHCYGCSRSYPMDEMATCTRCNDLFCASCSDLAVIDADRTDLGVHVYCTACREESKHEARV
jgi:hypothetical protein